MVEEVHRLRCKGKEEYGRHKDGSRIDPRGDVLINEVEGVEEGVAPIDRYCGLQFRKGGGVSEDAREEIMTGRTRSRGTPAISCFWTDLAYWASASFYHRWSWL